MLRYSLRDGGSGVCAVAEHPPCVEGGVLVRLGVGGGEMAGVVMVSGGCRGGEGGGRRVRVGEVDEDDEQRDSQLSLVALLLAALRRSVVACRVDRRKDVISAVHKMEIGWPTEVRHVTHVTFDRFNGFLGLPLEFEVEIPCRVPSASASVFGVSPESMQCCYDSKGNSVPTILLLMQERLYAQGGLKAEGIFRINPENSQEEHVRDQLNKGVVPDDIDVHCLAGLIKAWFRELPEGVLDCLSPEQVLQCNTEEECVELVKLLLPTQAALLNWAVDLMADVVEEVDVNKMNARNIAMVFAPNMTQMSDPLTALMHAVQVMNFLKTLILKTLREREDASVDGYSPFSRSPWSDEHSEDDLDSRQRRVVDMSGELGQTSEYDHGEYCQDDDGGDVSGELMGDDHHVSYSHSMADEADSMEGIEECFLRRLELNEQIGDDVVAAEPIGRGGEDVVLLLRGGDQATQVSSSSSSGLNVTSDTSMSGSNNNNNKQGSSTSTSDEEEDWEASFCTTVDAIPNSESPSKQIGDGLEEEFLKCQQQQKQSS